MNPSIPSYRYFTLPHQFSTYRPEPQRCELCDRSLPGYEGPFFGKREVAFVCEECLVSGRLIEAELFTNRGDTAALEQQLAHLQPELTSQTRQVLAQEQTRELEQRTPHLVTWQDFLWPVHCGEYCRFLKEIGQPGLNRLAPDGRGMVFFAEHALWMEGLAHAEEVWPGVRPDIPEDGQVAYAIGVYLFQCQHCHEAVLLWDAD
ncbi:MAG TPA: CbrC family protein [Ktedonobacterales bacterium]|jgi:hypothetical protein